MPRLWAIGSLVQLAIGVLAVAMIANTTANRPPLQRRSSSHTDASSFDLAALYPWLPSSWRQGVDLLKDRPWDNSRINGDCPQPARSLISPCQMGH
jgi:hypothetical protein